jgi:hypothetical protein
MPNYLHGFYLAVLCLDFWTPTYKILSNLLQDGPTLEIREMKYSALEIRIRWLK